jgi:polyhydroxybutyrate depolymerase
MRASLLPDRRALLVVAAVAALAACSSKAASSAVPTSTAAGSSTTGAASSTTIPAAKVAAQPSPGCTAATKVAPGDLKVNTTSSRTARYYFRHVPPSYTGTTPVPLVIDLHGYSEGATIHTVLSGLGPFGDGPGFITLTPQGSGTKIPLWNTDLKSADVRYIGDLLDEAEKTLCVDQRRIYSTGLSNGAFMTSAIACAYSDRIAAVAPVAGIRDIAGCKFTRPVPVIAFHGTADPFVAYTGGLGPKALELPTPDGKSTLGKSGIAKGATKGPSIPTITADWAKRNGCGTKPAEQQITNDVTRLSFPCPAGAEVVLERVTAGGHSWPGSPASVAIGSYVGKTTMTISANSIMWEFFEAHPLRN